MLHNYYVAIIIICKLTIIFMSFTFLCVFNCVFMNAVYTNYSNYVALYFVAFANKQGATAYAHNPLHNQT